VLKLITKIVKIDEQNIDHTKVLFASQIIKKGGIIAFPTDTIYGLGCDVFNLQSIRTLFKLKQRPTTKPLAILVCSKEQVKEIAIDIPNKFEELVEKFWPGGLTIILKKNKRLDPFVTSNLGTIGVRMPANRITLELIESVGKPLVATSASSKFDLN